MVFSPGAGRWQRAKSVWRRRMEGATDLAQTVSGHQRSDRRDRRRNVNEKQLLMMPLRSCFCLSRSTARSTSWGAMEDATKLRSLTRWPIRRMARRSSRRLPYGKPPRSGNTVTVTRHHYRATRSCVPCGNWDEKDGNNTVTTTVDS